MASALTTNNYPLKVGGVADYPVKVGSMLLTLVDPSPGYERAYNRWYERDHYYAGCMVGPYCFAGSRWVATRELKDLRWPKGDETIARPTDAGSYVSIYWVEKGHHQDFFGNWAGEQVHRLYADGRGFPERHHIHTILFDHLGAVYRDPDPVPIDLALDACYDAIVATWFDAAKGTAADLHTAIVPLMTDLVVGSSIEIASSWTPSAGESEPKAAPMDLGSRAGGPERLCQLFFVRGNVRDAIGRFHTYTDRITAAGLATTHLVAPFVRTITGTDTYTDQLW